ncbi:hypothetical protein [Palleronia rufa]|uniref:hypothetical protein n=1 Tax=Palleronia rufa TaxID=1530186 RepID=UPI00056740D0|nr:hypothetical protein [Palleronia rufa]
MTPAEIYRPRPLRALPGWRVGGLRLKLYHIGTAAPGEALLALARDEAARIAPEAAREGGAHGLGFAVLHEGEDGTWLLLDWWAHGGILCQRLSLSTGAGFDPVAPRPLVACVWELPVLAHERDAWVRHMMRDPASPEGYLADLRPGATV